MTNNPSPSVERTAKRPIKMILTLVAITALAFLIAGPITSIQQAAGGQEMKQAPAIDLTKPYSGNLERALFAGGCFWGTQYEFQQLPGVVNSAVGYTGGHFAKPTYQDVCSHKTGHAETVYIEFDPKKLSYRQLVNYFWTIHDPTTVNRQGFDMGDNYRSAIFYTTPEQKTIAEDCKKQESQKRSPIATQIVAATVFYPAEEYHQNYDVKHGSKSCAAPAPAK
jgi:methionine-S-sulfoxide reductase